MTDVKDTPSAHAPGGFEFTRLSEIQRALSHKL